MATDSDGQCGVGFFGNGSNSISNSLRSPDASGNTGCDESEGSGVNPTLVALQRAQQLSGQLLSEPIAVGPVGSQTETSAFLMLVS